MWLARVIVALRQFGTILRPHDGGHASLCPPYNSWRTPSRSRGMICPSFASVVTLVNKRAQGAPDAQRTRGSHAKQNATGTPEHRHSLRNGLRLIRGLLGVPCALATVASSACRSEGRHRQSARLIPASGDRDNTISLVRTRRHSSVDAARVHRIPRSTLMTMRNAPPASMG
jgi:hypothetical protein